MASVHLRCCARRRSKACLCIMRYLRVWLYPCIRQAFLLLLAQPEVIGAIESSSGMSSVRYGVDLSCKKQPLIKGRGVSYCKNLLSPRFEQSGDKNFFFFCLQKFIDFITVRLTHLVFFFFKFKGESETVLDKTYYVFLPPELCVVHPLSGSLVRGAQKLPSIMRRVESMLLAVQLKNLISFPIPTSKVSNI